MDLILFIFKIKNPDKNRDHMLNLVHPDLSKYGKKIII